MRNLAVAERLGERQALDRSYCCFYHKRTHARTGRYFVCSCCCRRSIARAICSCSSAIFVKPCSRSASPWRGATSPTSPRQASQARPRSTSAALSRGGAGACVPSGNEAAQRCPGGGRSPAPASVYTKSCPLSLLRGERGKPRHECTKPGGQAVEFFARNREGHDAPPTGALWQVPARP